MLQMHAVGDAEAELSWLGDNASGAMTGYDAVGWENSTWILHAMYENLEARADLTHDQAHRAGLQDGTVQPLLVGGLDLDEMTTATGVPLGYENRPDHPWRRLRWSQHARQLGLSNGIGPKAPPCHRWFPAASWPLNITPPTEGSLDAASLSALIDVLAHASSVGPNTPCLAFYGSVPANKFDRPTLFRGPLAAIPELVVGPDAFPGSPSNIWSADRTWFVWTDWDLWGTKVSGSAALMTELRDHRDLETLDWPLRPV